MNEPMIATIMSQAQAFASSWSLVGSRFEADDQLEQAEAEKAGLRRMVAELIAERDTLRAKVEAMEKQEPVARYNWREGKVEWLQKWDFSKHNMKPLYLAAGAQGENNG
jgi:pantoate kinase